MKKIEIEHLSFSYDEQIKALDDVSFSIEEGSYTVIVGHNGSGKSTIAKLLIGLLEAQSGTIRVDGIELIKWASCSRIRIISLSVRPWQMISRLVWKIIRCLMNRCSRSSRNSLPAST